MMKKVYLSHVRGKGGLEKRLMAYMEYLIISVIVHAKRSRGKPTESCDGGQRWRIAQVTYTLLNTCWNVTITGDRTRPRAACRISRTAAV